MAKDAGIDNSIYEAALAGLEIQRQRIEEQIRQVKGLLSGTPKKAVAAAPAAAAAVAAGPRKKRRLSAAARKRIAEAQKKRWAAFRKNQGGA